MTASEESFVRTLRDDPDDDTSLLVFADWLDDRDDPRAELLRIQCELSRWVPDLLKRQELRRREFELLATLEPHWMGPLPPYCLDWKRERGLVCLDMQSRRFHGKRFAKEAATWFLHSWVGGVRLTGTTDLPFIFFHDEQLAEVADLDVGGNTVSGLTFRALVESPHLENLRQLELAHCGVTDEDLLLLIVSPRFQNLRYLDLRNNRISDTGLINLLKAADPARLRRLAVHGNDLSLAGIAALLRWQSRRPPLSESPRRIMNSLGMEFVEVPAGTFLMGSPREEKDRYNDEDPRRAVTLTKAYFLGVTPVTQQQFMRVMGRNPSRATRGRTGGMHNPVESVNWNEVVEFCAALSESREEMKAGYRYRLPTEAEWEHACRAGTETPFCFGETITSQQANFDGNFPYQNAPRGPYRNSTTPVGLYRPNAFGLFDMHGNVWEWCADWFNDEYYGLGEDVDPAGPTTGSDRVLRGGGWYNNAGSCRSAYRYWEQPGDSDDDIGFRVVLIPSGDTEPNIL